MTQTDFNFGRLAEFGWLHAAVDCAEHAGVEDFIEQVIPELNTRPIIELWALGGMLQQAKHYLLAQFVTHYATKAEAYCAALGAEWEPDCMPSPLRIWGDWLAARAYKRGRRDGRLDTLVAAEQPAPPPPEPPGRPVLAYSRDPGPDSAA